LYKEKLQKIARVDTISLIPNRTIWYIVIPLKYQQCRWVVGDCCLTLSELSCIHLDKIMVMSTLYLTSMMMSTLYLTSSLIGFFIELAH
jgi:hypothetical protein